MHNSQRLVTAKAKIGKSLIMGFVEGKMGNIWENRGLIAPRHGLNHLARWAVGPSQTLG